MSEINKNIRLTKAASELNISWMTAHETLEGKGFSLDKNPNSKLSDEMYDVLTQEYAKDRKLKQQADQIIIGAAVPKKETLFAPNTNTERKENPFEAYNKANQAQAAKTIDQNEPTPKTEPIKIEQLKTEPTKTEQPTTEPTKVEPTKTEQPTTEPTKAETNQTPKPEPKPHTAETQAQKQEPEKTPTTQQDTSTKPIEPKATTSTLGSKILGKIDLTEYNESLQKQKDAETEAKKLKNKQKRDRRKKKKLDGEPDDTNTIEPNTTPQAQPKNAVEPNTTPQTQTKDTTEPNTTTQVEEETVIRAKGERLQGTTVIGKLDLTQYDKKPTTPSEADKKRKRKRKDKKGEVVASSTQEPNKFANKTTQAPILRDADGNPLTGPNRPIVPINRENRPRPNDSNAPNRPPNTAGTGQNRPRTGTNTGNSTGGNNRFQPKSQPDKKSVSAQISQTNTRLNASSKFSQRSKDRKGRRNERSIASEERQLREDMEQKQLKLTEFITSSELASLMDIDVNEVISTCFALGKMVNINQRLDAEIIEIVASEFGFEVEFVDAQNNQEDLTEPDAPENLQTRAPIVTIMGHVDHGKTSLLDYIRNENVIAGEAGGITQHIGAYEVELPNGRNITFLDTPGHEAFTAMRARGAKVTDIVVIVIAADDSVMPQTKEAIAHAQAANVPIIFAYNKIDKPGADIARVQNQLLEMSVMTEQFGGKYQEQGISAKKGLHIDELLEKILLEADLLDLKADSNKRAAGTIIEATLDKGKGIITTILVQGGTLRVGDNMLSGAYFGKVKALINERGQRIKSAGPSQPVQILGLSGTPTAGDMFYIMETESKSREIANKRQQLIREQGLRARKHITLDEIGRRLAIGNFQQLNIVIKGDVDGSVEALSGALLKLTTEKIQTQIVHSGVGQINDSDVLLASASDAIIVGFNVRPLPSARKLAENEQIDIRYYSIIYDAIEEIKSAMEGMLAPTFEEKIVCNVEVREVYKITKVGTIAGCYVLDGKINRNTKIRIIRDGVVVHNGELASLKRYKDDVKEVATSYECGLNINNFNDIRVGDIVEGYEKVEVKSKL